MLEEKKETYVIENKIIPFLKTYLIENTVKINYKKLLNATQYISISLLAWLQAVTEHKTSALHSIDWQNHNLHARVHDLKEHFCIILEKELSKSRRIKHTEMLPNKIKIYNEKICLVENKTSLSTKGKITANNTVSPNLAIKLLDVMDEIILRKKYQKKRMEKGSFIRELHKNSRAQIDLTTVSMRLRRKTQSVRKDAISEALLKIILPELSDKGHMLTKDINFVKLCWEELPDALKKIGCTNVILNKEGDKDEHSIQSKHASLNTPLISFHAFRQRMARMVERTASHL